MAHPTLRRGDDGDAVKALQELLNRIGALLITDGDFGPGSERAVKEAQKIGGLVADGVAGNATWDWLEVQPEPSADMPTEAVTFIAREEVGSRNYYERHTAMPHWPGGASGITIGIGYDLRFQQAAFEEDWGDVLPANVIALLQPFLSGRGSADDASGLEDIRIEFPVAWKVFTRKTLPEYVGQTRGAFPGCDALPALCFGLLVSLVYNRGPGMKGDRRREMRAIRDHIEGGTPEQVPEALESMKRLWPNSAGLRGRRDREADLWRKGLRRSLRGLG